MKDLLLDIFERIRPMLRYIFNNPRIEYAFYIVTFIVSYLLIRRFIFGVR